MPDKDVSGPVNAGGPQADYGTGLIDVVVLEDNEPGRKASIPKPGPTWKRQKRPSGKMCSSSATTASKKSSKKRKVVSSLAVEDKKRLCGRGKGKLTDSLQHSGGGDGLDSISMDGLDEPTCVRSCNPTVASQPRREP